jgi:hypothetical protein
LLAALAASGPAVEGEELVFDLDPHSELDAVLRVLHTGVRALLDGRRWYGCGSERTTAGPRALDPGGPIPDGITLLCVEGDRCWDRISPDAWYDHPGLFDAGE